MEVVETAVDPEEVPGEVVVEVEEVQEEVEDLPVDKLDFSDLRHNDYVQYLLLSIILTSVFFFRLNVLNEGFN